jgi:hypothetical protein
MLLCTNSLHKATSQHDQQSNGELSKQSINMTPMQLKLNFVHTSSSGVSDDGGNRRLVRSNAMRQYHAAKRNTLVAEYRKTIHVKQAIALNSETSSKTSQDGGYDNDLSVLVGESEQPANHGPIFDRHLNSRRPLTRMVLPAPSRIDRSRVPSLHGYLGSGRTDPFLTYPLPLLGFEELIIDYCKFAFSIEICISL